MNKENVVCIYIYMYIYIYVYMYIHIHIHTHTMDYNSAIKKNEILSFAGAWMDSEVITRKVSQEEKDKYHMVSLICGT